ncbi:hypothetical protein [Rhodoflexus sp.]
MISQNEFFRFSLSKQCTLLGKEGQLLGIRRDNKHSVKLYVLYDFMVEVHFESTGWISTTALPDTSLLSLYPRCFGEA